MNARWLRALLAALVLGALVIGIPVLLAAVAGWPLPRQVPDWDRALRMLRQNDIPAETVINTIAVIAWLAWAQLAWSVVWEFLVNLPAARQGRAGRSAPLVPRAMSHGIARLVATIVAAGVITSGATANAASLAALTATAHEMPLHRATVVAHQPFEPGPADPPTNDQPSHTAAAPTWEIRRGDTLWDIAEVTLGDGLRVAEILELNPQISSPRRLLPGQVITLPPDAVVPTEREAATAHVEPAASIDSEIAQQVVPAAVVTVSHGDSLWAIASRHLDDHGRNGDSEVARYVTDIVRANPGAIDNPDLIHPGQVLQLPAVDANQNTPLATVVPAAAAEPEPVDAPTAEPEPESAAAEQQTASALPPQPDEDPFGTPAPEDANAEEIEVARSVVSTEGPSPERSTTSEPTPAENEVEPAESADDPFEGSRHTVWWSLPGSLLLGAGVAAVIRRRRTQRLADVLPGEQLPAPSDTTAAVERAVTARWDERRAATLARILDTLTPASLIGGELPEVRAVELTDEVVEVLLRRPDPVPPPGWTTINGGASWVHRLDEPLAPETQRRLAPTLITLGHRTDGGAVLLDLGSAGSLSVSGSPDIVRGVARAVAYELATYPLGTPADVSLIGLDLPGADHFDRTWTNATLRSAATRLADPDVDDAAVLDDALHVYVIDLAAVDETEQDLVDIVLEASGRRDSVAVILLGEHPDTTEHLHVVDADRAIWSGAHLTPVLVTEDAADEIEDVMDDLDSEVTEPIEAPAELVDSVLYDGVVAESARITINGHSPLTNGSRVTVSDEQGYVVPDHDVLIRVLGEVSVTGRPITAPTDVEMVALLACLRLLDRNLNIDMIDAMLGRENAIKTLQSRMSRIRAKLGVGSDDHDLLPAAATGRGIAGRYRLSPRVLTDVDLIEHRYHAARNAEPAAALTMLSDGLELFGGPPFRGPRAGYGWASTEGVVSRIVNLVNAYASELMRLAFEVGDIPLVLDTVSAAARVIEDPVAQHPMRLVEARIAEECCDPLLRESVGEARTRLAAHTNEATEPHRV